MKTKHFSRLEFYFLCFFTYSVLGWCYEVFLETVIYRWGFSNRGFLFGPYCPVYGFGALLMIFTLSWLTRQRIPLGRVNLAPVVVFCAATALTTALELLTSYLLEAATGGWLWDYTDYMWNFQGRIAFSTSVRFGLGGMLFLYILQPLLVKIDRAIDDRARHILFFVLAGLMLIDLLTKVL